jgi:hypothetical protein
MPGGIIQLAVSGDEDIYLYRNPDITFFKKVYHRHTNFAMELKEITFKNTPSYNSSLYFNLKNQGDLLHRIYVQVDIPVLSLTDSIITDSNYTTEKSSRLSTISTSKTSWTTKHTNLVNFAEIEITYYKTFTEALSADTCTVSILQSKLSTLETTYSTDRDTYKALIDSTLLSQVNQKTYIDSLASETMTAVSTEIDLRYDILKRYLKYYHANMIYYTNKYTTVNTGNINYGWSKFLGHYYFTNYEFELGGNSIDNYSSDQLHIFQSHNISKNEEDNYNKMIGNEEEIYKYGIQSRTTKSIFIPLIFWFCRNQSDSFPLVSTKYSDARLKLEVNKKTNLIYFQDWETEYNNLLIIDIPLEDHSTNSDGSPIKNSSLLISKIEILYPSYIYRYTCTTINKELIDQHFPGIDSDSILNNYGSLDSDLNNVLTLEDYSYLMNNLSSDTLLTTSTKTKFAGYHYFVDYNYLLNQLADPTIKLYGEYIYLDDIERLKFSSSKLEYLVELFSEETVEISDVSSINHNIDNALLVKHMSWFIKPKLLNYGVSTYGRVYNSIFDKNSFYTYDILDDIEININNLDLLKQSSINNYYKNTTSYNLLNNKLPDGVYFYNFCLSPESNQPSGTFNLSRISGKVIRIFVNQNFRDEYFDSDVDTSSINPNNYGLEFKILFNHYNILAIHKGEGGLVFYQK